MKMKKRKMFNSLTKGTQVWNFQLSILFKLKNGQNVCENDTYISIQSN